MIPETSSGDGGGKVIRKGRTLDEARALIEQSFGNYVGSEVMVAAKQQLARLQFESERLEKESTEDDAMKSLTSRLTRTELSEYISFKSRVKVIHLSQALYFKSYASLSSHCKCLMAPQM